ncbi:MAG: biopolymer transporter ExbD [Deltaproteobacteria bacterium]|jgi:biopolymer transport protein ExbD|nr:biopolymer transporter ExbD [Deltaproteobacteria bacterium]
MAGITANNEGPMRALKTREEDATFELNLAPMLDIIVSIIPMLLLSVVFVQITVIDTPIPQAVEQAVAAANEKNKDLVQVRMSVANDRTVMITILDRGATKEFQVAGIGSGTEAKADLDGLYKQVIAIKKQYPDVFRLELNPSDTVPLVDIVGVMDSVRTTRVENGKPVKLSFTDVTTGKPIETNLLFPDIVFGNVAGG